MVQLPEMGFAHGSYGDAKAALHVAVKFDAPEELVLTLLHERPDAASEAHPVDGLCGPYLPLHTAAKWAASAGLVRALLAAHPAAASEPMPIPPLRGVFSATRRIDPR
eukprot:5628773-Prymnesium_polylepis.1